MTSSAPAYGSLDEVIGFDWAPAYYGHKPADRFSTAFCTNQEIERSLLAFSSSSPTLNAALTAIFSSPEWISESGPIDRSLLRDEPIRVKVRDETGEWWPCQLGCPGRVPEKGERIKQANHATEHIEWHLGIWRHACSVCKETFSRKAECDKHEQVHKDTKNIPCEHGCGKHFERNKSGNMNRHFKFACTSNPGRVAVGPSRASSSGGSVSG